MSGPIWAELPESQYQAALGTLQSGSRSMTSGKGNTYVHYFKQTITSDQGTGKVRMKRLTKELKTMKHTLPLSSGASAFIRTDTARPYVMQALITGPRGTPYCGGCYLFDIFCSSDYPAKCPKVNLMTTGKGTVRFNPNLYNSGKVCLSLLGTWAGQNASQGWTKKSTLLQIVVSIQSAILGVKYPYFNEPGREGYFDRGDSKPLPPHLERQARTDSNGGYENLRVQNIKWGVVDALQNPPDGFEEVVRRHFFMRRHELRRVAQEWLEEGRLVEEKEEEARTAREAAAKAAEDKAAKAAAKTKSLVGGLFGAKPTKSSAQGSITKPLPMMHRAVVTQQRGHVAKLEAQVTAMEAELVKLEKDPPAACIEVMAADPSHLKSQQAKSIKQANKLVQELEKAM